MYNYIEYGSSSQKESMHLLLFYWRCPTLQPGVGISVFLSSDALYFLAVELGNDRYRHLRCGFRSLDNPFVPLLKRLSLEL